MRKKLLSVVALAFAAALSTGVAVTASADDAVATQNLEGFAVKAVSVRIDENEENKSGIRFQTVTPEGKAAYEGAKCYTQLGVEATVTPEGATEPVTKVWTLDVNANVWRATGENGWNTVLANIPADSYAKEITAQSFIAVSDTEVYATEVKSASIAWAASQVLAGGGTAEKLNTYVAGAVQSITLDKTTLAMDQFNATATLTATIAPANFGVVWTSSNPAVATVKNGVVTAVGNGTATITASMGGVEATCEVTATNMPITFSEENPAEVVTVLGTSAASNGSVLSVMDFNGGKVYGTADTKITGRDMYFQISYAAVASYFEAYPTAAAVSFNTYANNRANSMRVYVRGTNATNASEYTATYLGGQYDAEKVIVNDATYYKHTYVINRAFFENVMTAGVDVLFRYYAEVNTVTTEFYVDNFGMVTEFTAEYDFEESGYVTPVAWLGSDKTGRNGTNMANITIKDSNNVETTTRVLTANQAVTGGQTALNSSTTYLGISRDYLDMVFADPKVTHFQFDLIGDWTPSDNFKVQDNTYTGNILLQGYSTAKPVTVGGKEGFYKFTIVLPR